MPYIQWFVLFKEIWFLHHSCAVWFMQRQRLAINQSLLCPVQYYYYAQDNYLNIILIGDLDSRREEKWGATLCLIIKFWKFEKNLYLEAKTYNSCNNILFLNYWFSLINKQPKTDRALAQSHIYLWKNHWKQERPALPRGI